MKTLVFGALFLVWAGFAHSQESNPRIAIVVIKRTSESEPLIERVSRELKGRATVSVEELSSVDMSNPIERGKLVALLEDRDLVVPVGNDATRFVTREVEDARIYFVGADLVRGDWMKSNLASGIFSYNVDRLLDAVKELSRGTLGFAYTPGYEPVAEWVRRGARQRGIALREKRVTSLKELTPAIRELLDNAGIVWVAGDPMLARGAGFDFLAERSLSQKVPAVAPSPADLQLGAFMSFEPAAGPLAAKASQDIESLLEKGGGPKFDFAPSGTVMINHVLSRKWGIAVPAGAPMRLTPP